MDDVNIVSVGGKIPEEMPWATEYTLSRIAKLLAETNKTSSSEARKILEGINDSSDSADTRDSRRDLIEKKNANEREKAAAEAKKQRASIAKEQLKQFSEKMGVSTDGFLGSIGKTFNPLSQAAGIILDTAKDQAIRLGGLYEKAYKSGLNFNKSLDGAVSGFDAVRQISGGWDISMENMLTSSEQYSKYVNAVGLSEVKMTENVKKYTSKLKQFGMTQAETLEHMMAYGERHRVLGLQASISSKQDAARREESFKSLSKWAKVLGMSTKDLEAQRLAETQTVDTASAAFNIEDEDKRESYTSAISDLKGAGFELQTNMINDMMNKSDPLASSLLQEFKQLTAGSGLGNDYAELVTEMKAGNVSGDDFKKQLMDIMARTSEYTKENKENEL